ncbi:MAG: hypothetical protein B7X04_04080 [Parcubacteria group bacterium 21-54-25]|nr:MAG: hypothetical protein B7X04_04080 [Parcubacteria group bacterium 21-54-25]HQU08242.1 hypothetical protein [Candidatus Paceibacterota bacterium]
MASSAFSMVLATTSVRSVLVYRLGVLHEFLTAVFFSGAADAAGEASIASFVARHNASPDDATFLRSLPASFWHALPRDSFEHELSRMDEDLKAQPLFPLTLAQPLPARLLETIGAWVRQEIGRDLLVDVAIDPSVVAGCRFVWRDHLHDFSFPHLIASQSTALAAMAAQSAAS